MGKRLGRDGIATITSRARALFRRFRRASDVLHTRRTKPKRRALRLSPLFNLQSITIGVLGVASIVLIATDSLPDSIQRFIPSFSIITPESDVEDAEPLRLLPSDEVMEELFDATESGKAAAQNAIGYYKEQNAPRLAIYTQQELLALSGENTEEEVNVAPRVDEIIVTKAAEGDAEIIPSDTALSVAYGMRRFGGFGADELRPVVLEVARRVADVFSQHAQMEAMTHEERMSFQAAFRESTRFHQLVRQIGARVGTVWAPPRERYTPDGAIVALTLANDGQLLNALIQHSTGRDLYDASVLQAAKDAAPYDEIQTLEPWLRPVFEQVRLSFGTPPITPDEHRRRQESGTLHGFRIPEGDEAMQDINAYEENFYDTVRDQVSAEFIARNPAQYPTIRDSKIQVHLSNPLGVVMDVTVEASSGSAMFDQMAKEAVDAASPFRGMRALSHIEQSRMERFVLHFHPGGVR